jgi:Trk K+ transport system NAD-binding subunit
MKSLPLVLTTVSSSLRQRNVRLLFVLLGIFTVLVAVFSGMFHVLMNREGQSHSWPTSVYWTLVTMTTLGFGDITFESDAGRVFSVVVLLSGTVFLLVLLPFTFIQFVFLPWMALREQARAPRQVPAHMSGHLVLTGLGPIEEALARRADLVDVPYVIIAGDRDETLRLHDRGYSVMVGDIDDPAAYRAARVDAAAVVAATRSDTTNTNIAFTVQEITEHVPIVATASSPASIDILVLAGADLVLQLGELLGTAMGERALGPDGRTHVIGEFAGVRIAEASVAGTSLAGTTLGEARLRARLGIGILGVWRRGTFDVATSDTVLEPTTVLLMAGTAEQLAAYDAAHAVGTAERPTSAVVIGGGRVGRAAGRTLARQGVDYRIIEQRPERIRDPDVYVLGDAADIAVLKEGGIDDAGTVVITTHDDDMNVYLTIYCRRLRPDLWIVARANLDRNITTLYRAGADAVLSYASTGATAIWNHLRRNDTLLVAEGLHVFRRPVPPALAGRTLGEAHIRRYTGCTVVAVEDGGQMRGNPDPTQLLPASGQLVLVGDPTAEARFVERYSPRRRRRRRVVLADPDQLREL